MENVEIFASSKGFGGIELVESELCKSDLQKKQLRKEVLAQRGCLSAEQLEEKSNAIVDRLLSLEEYKNAHVIMAYVDFRNEVKTAGLICRCLEEGKRVVVPITDKANKALIPSEIIHFPEDLRPGTWGILEPAPDKIRPVDPKELDLVVVPGVAFSPDGDRLGYGGGFYDRFLPRTKPETVFAALAFELQIRDNVFPGQYDCPMHLLITEKSVFSIKQ